MICTIHLLFTYFPGKATRRGIKNKKRLDKEKSNKQKYTRINFTMPQPSTTSYHDTPLSTVILTFIIPSFGDYFTQLYCNIPSVRPSKKWQHWQCQKQQPWRITRSTVLNIPIWCPQQQPWGILTIPIKNNPQTNIFQLSGLVLTIQAFTHL